MAEKKHRKHLKSRKSKAFNTLSKYQEDAAKVAAQIVWETIVKKYPKLKLNNFDTLGVKDLDAHYALEYINRGLKIKGLPERKETDLQAFGSANGIKPDGGIFFVQSKKDGFNHIIGALEGKHQGEKEKRRPINPASTTPTSSAGKCH